MRTSELFDQYTTYVFLQLLSKPFNQWDAFRLGIIDSTGRVLRPKATLRTQAEKDAWGYMEILVANLRRDLLLVPGGNVRLSTFMSALDYARERVQTGSEPKSKVHARLTTTAPIGRVYEDGGAVAVNSAGGGAIAGIGVGAQGDPGIRKRKRPKLFRRQPLI